MVVMMIMRMRMMMTMTTTMMMMMMMMMMMTVAGGLLPSYDPAIVSRGLPVGDYHADITPPFIRCASAGSICWNVMMMIAKVMSIR
jgi:hypothetical protein